MVSNAILSAILQTAVDAIIVIDEHGTIQSFNPATERMFGFTSIELLGKNVRILMPSPYHHEHDGYLSHYRQTGERKVIGVGREVLGQRKDGTTFPLHLAVSEVNIENRKLFTGILRDISDLKNVQQQLQDLIAGLDERTKEQTQALYAAQAELVKQEKLATMGQVSAGIAHEIRNPLNAVKTSAYFLLNAPSISDDKRREHLERIDRQVTIINNIVTALADIARLPEPKTQPCKIRDLIQSGMEGVLLDTGIKVENHVSNELPSAIADGNQLPIVFRNLIRNARDAMPSGGVLTLSAQIKADHILIQVTDTGTGIAPEDLTRITEPFFSTKALGMGLGLSISKAIVEKNGGKINVESKVGQGTTFSVMLPKSKEA